MCGIIGLYGKSTNFYPQAKKNFIFEGLIADTVRGFDSTGMVLLPSEAKEGVRIYKRDLAGYDFVQQKHTNRLIDQINTSIGIIGHNRSATKGNVSDRNAHPFKHGHITLVHNGTVHNAQSLVDKKDQPDGLIVDSEYVTHALSMESADDILPKLTGGYSLVWFDEEDRSLHFARNDAKPMFIAFDAKDEQIYFGSEAEMIVWLCSRNNLPIENPIFRTTPSVHYIIKNPQKVREIEKRPFSQGQSATFKDRMKQAGLTGTGLKNIPAMWAPTKGQMTPSTTKHSGPFAEMAAKEVDRQSGSTDGAGKGYVAQDGEGDSYQKETICAGDASGIKKEAVGDRLEELTKVLMDHNVSGNMIVARALRWYAYQTRPNEEIQNIGWVIAYPTNVAVKPMYLQIFGVTKKRYEEELKDSAVFLEPVNYRKNRTPTQIVCRIREDLQKKHGERLKERTSQKDSGGLVDGGTKEDWVEIGTSRKRWVNPFEYWDLVRNGCYNCAITLPTDSDKIMWCGINDDRPVCDDCCDNPQIVEALTYIQ